MISGNPGKAGEQVNALRVLHEDLRKPLFEDSTRGQWMADLNKAPLCATTSTPYSGSLGPFF